MEYVVARIGRPHGVKGEVTVELRTDSPELRFFPGSVLRTDPASAGPLTVVSARFHQETLLVVFDGVTGREGVEALRNTLLLVDVADGAEGEEEDAWYPHQLQGLAAVTPGGVVLGTVRDLLTGLAQDLLVVTGTDGGEVLVPFVAALVPEVDVRGGRVVLDPPLGLFVELPAPADDSGTAESGTDDSDDERPTPDVRVDVVTIFGEYLQPLQLSLIGKAQQQHLLDVRVHDLREHTHDRHRTVDSPPYGGGAGLLMRPEPWGEALDAVLADPPAGARDDGPVLLVPSPAGKVFTQAAAVQLAAEPWLVFACGRYEGIDARVAEHYSARVRVREVSLGDYVLNGGEVAVLVVVEAVARLLPGVVGNAASLELESHAAEHDGLLEHPAYTKPASWRGLDVPAVLSSGHHAQVERWRREESLRRTARRRPDLLATLSPAVCDPADLAVLAVEGFVPGDAGGFRPDPGAVAD